MSTRAQVNYEGYRESAGGVSLVSGAELPAWEQLDPQIQAAWDAGAGRVELLFAERYRAVFEMAWRAAKPLVAAAAAALRGVAEDTS